MLERRKNCTQTENKRSRDALQSEAHARPVLVVMVFIGEFRPRRTLLRRWRSTWGRYPSLRRFRLVLAGRPVLADRPGRGRRPVLALPLVLVGLVVRRFLELLVVLVGRVVPGLLPLLALPG